MAICLALRLKNVDLLSIIQKGFRGFNYTSSNDIGINVNLQGVMV